MPLDTDKEKKIQYCSLKLYPSLIAKINNILKKTGLKRNTFIEQGIILRLSQIHYVSQNNDEDENAENKIQYCSLKLYPSLIAKINDFLEKTGLKRNTFIEQGISLRLSEIEFTSNKFRKKNK